jgi:hypothetical protein
MKQLFFHMARFFLSGCSVLICISCGDGTLDAGDPESIDTSAQMDSDTVLYDDSSSSSENDVSSDHDSGSDTGIVPGPVDINFSPGSYIIPMDIEYQDMGMIEAYGLVYQLLLANINVYWVIKHDKLQGEVDFSTTAVDFADGSVIADHGYRGGPFVIMAKDAPAAGNVIVKWQSDHSTVVHKATKSFSGEVARIMVKAPRIAILATGTEKISFDYMNAAGIPDSKGQMWPDKADKTGEYAEYPDILTVAEVRGLTDSDNKDGALFDKNGVPAFCELMTMHWDVKDRDEGAIAEIREYLHYPVHFFAECQSVNAVENAENGHFLTPHGYIMDKQPEDVDFLSPYLPFSQMDGQFKTVGGSEPSYTLPEGDSYYDDGVVMLTEKGTPIGVRDVWMTGYLDGECEIDIIIRHQTGSNITGRTNCPGKISYLGGHKYSTKVPISKNPDSQGTRFFLNALFEADCVTSGN